LALLRVADIWTMSDSAVSLPRARSSALPLRVLNDDRLVKLVAGGNDAAFSVLYARHHQALYRYCATIVRHEHDAQDVLQTTMIRALTSLQRAVPDAPVRPWLFRIAHNEAITLLRRRRPTQDIDDARGVAGPALERQVEDRGRLALLVSDLNELPDRQRGALVMRELSGLSHEEIATTLGISIAGAKQAIFDARTGLQEFAKGRDMHCAEIERLISDADGRMLRGRPVRSHLRACASCSALRDAITTRKSELAALAPPLPVLAATGLLTQILGGGGQGGAGGALMTVGAAGKATTAMLAGKAVATAAVVATVGIGATQMLPALSTTPQPRTSTPTAPATEHRAPAAAVTGTSSSPRGARQQALQSGSARSRRDAARSSAAATQPDPAATPANSTAANAHRRPAGTANDATGRPAGTSTQSPGRPAASRRPTATNRGPGANATSTPRPAPVTPAPHATGPSAAASPTVPVAPAAPVQTPPPAASSGASPPAVTPPTLPATPPTAPRAPRPAP